MSMVLESQEDWTDYRLQAIAKRHLAEHVDKTEQKRGWDQPTLRHAKLAYAAEGRQGDVCRRGRDRGQATRRPRRGRSELLSGAGAGRAGRDVVAGVRRSAV
jgi:hypothetical protein